MSKSSDMDNYLALPEGVWLDTRIHKPHSNSWRRYPVMFLHGEFLFDGYAFYGPDGCDYTSGVWKDPECRNGNPLGGEVLYWMKIPHFKKTE